MHPNIVKVDEKLVGDFFNLKSRSDVATLFGMADFDLERMLYRGNFSRHYRTFNIKKKNGSLRKIDAPNKWLKELQQQLHHVMARIYFPKSSACAYISDRGIVYNAKNHIHKKYVLNIDLKDFFPSINFGRVRAMFMSYPFELPSNVSSVLAQICCYNRTLPQGAPTSPIISNILCAKMDTNFFHFARKKGCVYSRYADDITFSTHSDRFPNAIAAFEWHEDRIGISLGAYVTDVVVTNGFKINENKITLRRRGSRQVVTGIVVNEKLNVKRSYIKNIRGALHALEKYGPDAEKLYQANFKKTSKAAYKWGGSLIDCLNGKIGYVKLVKGQYDLVYKKLRHRLDLCMGKESFLFRSINEEIIAALWVLEFESDENCDQGTAFMVEGVGLVTCQHVLGPNMYVYQYNKTCDKFPVAVVRESKDLDLAILKFTEKPEKKYHGFSFPKNTEVSIGQHVILAGFPQFAPGTTPTIINTEVASKKVEIGVNKIQISDKVISGNSGGPLLDSGLNIVGIADKGREDNLSSAIAVKELLKLLSK